MTELLVGVPFSPLAFEVMRFSSPPRYLADAPALLDRAIAAEETLAALSPRAFAQTKQKVRQVVADAMEQHGRRAAAASEDVWTAPATLDRIRDYVTRTFKKG